MASSQFCVLTVDTTGTTTQWPLAHHGNGLLVSTVEEPCEECGVCPATAKCLQCVGLYCETCFKVGQSPLTSSFL